MLPTILSDSYKQSHYQMYPKGLTKLYSNFTARKSRLGGVNKVVFFGLQYFLMEYLVKQFNEEFFNKPKKEVIDEHRRIVTPFSTGEIHTEQWEKLHDLGYLPLKIKAVKEGTFVPIGVPMLTVTNTHPDFAWLVNFIETILSTSMWQAITSATIANEYRKITTKWANKTGGDLSFIDWQNHDFSMRGMSSLESAMLSGAGHLTSFKGSDTIPAMVFLEQYYDTPGLIAGSVPACFPEGAEILTNKGFKLFEDLDEGDLVAQVINGESFFVEPLAYHEYEYEGELINFKIPTDLRYVDFTVTPNHRVVGITKNDDYVIKEAIDFNFHNDLKVPISTFKKYGHSKLTPYEKLLIAFQADGSFSARQNQYTGLNTGSVAIRFSLKKDRKAERLRNIISECGFNYTENKYENEYYSFRINVPKNECLSKFFDWVDLQNVNENWAKEFINELKFWDGNSPRDNIICYDSTVKANTDFVTALCAICGYKSQNRTYYDKRVNRKPVFSITILLNTLEVCGSKIIKTKIPYKGKVRCVTVESGVIIVKQNDRVIITGNSEHSVQSCGGKENELNTFERLIDTFPEGILSIVSDTWDLWKVCTEYLPALKDKILARSGKIVVRPDSGLPEDIICGTGTHPECPTDCDTWEKYLINKRPEWKHTEAEYKGVIELLWETFGGTINEKGYKVLDSHIGAIYGDSITIERANEICRRLELKGFCSTNIVFGIGSYTYQMNTRDTFGMAMKATYCEVDGVGKAIFKDPITDKGEKKSAKGLLLVQETGSVPPSLELIQDVTWDQERQGELEVVFEDGLIIRKQNLEEIRNLIKSQI